MKIKNVHERTIHADAMEAGKLLDNLGSQNNSLWPGQPWPPMRFNRPLSVGAKGGHGPIRYSVSEYQPEERVVFQFQNKKGLGKGLKGQHCFEILKRTPDRTGDNVTIRHTLDGRARGAMLWKWPLVVGPLHDALLEDALDQAQILLKDPVKHPVRHSLWVRLLLFMLKQPSLTAQ